jgi:hypothetical protein
VKRHFLPLTPNSTQREFSVDSEEIKVMEISKKQKKKTEEPTKEIG